MVLRLGNTDGSINLGIELHVISVIVVTCGNTPVIGYDPLYLKKQKFEVRFNTEYKCRIILQYLYNFKLDQYISISIQAIINCHKKVDYRCTRPRTKNMNIIIYQFLHHCYIQNNM